MTRANDRANAERKRLERNARRKITRLKNKGVATGSISPLRKVDVSDTNAVKRYNKQLRDFNSRQTQYIAGREGTPIEAKSWKKYLKLQKKWNKLHRAYWNKKKDKKLVGQDMTLYQKAAITARKTLFGALEYQRDLDPAKLTGEADLANRIEVLKRETAPSYAAKRAKKMRQDIGPMLERYNSQELTDAIDSLSTRQLVILQNESLFVEDFFTIDYAWSPMEWDMRINYLLDIVDKVSRM